MELRPYQIEARNAIFTEWESKDKTLLVLPTGCGKTVVFADVAKERTSNGKVLILAHREELLTQASDKIKKLCGLDCAMEKAEKEYAVFRIRQDHEYISEFDRQTEKYLKGE